MCCKFICSIFLSACVSMHFYCVLSCCCCHPCSFRQYQEMCCLHLFISVSCCLPSCPATRFASLKVQSSLYRTVILLFCCTPTVFQCGSVDLSTGWACPSSVEGLDHYPVLGKLLQVVQGVHFTVPRSFHLHYAVLAVAAWTVFSVPDLVASDNPVLQLLLRSLREMW